MISTKIESDRIHSLCPCLSVPFGTKTLNRRATLNYGTSQSNGSVWQMENDIIFTLLSKKVATLLFWLIILVVPSSIIAQLCTL